MSLESVRLLPYYENAAHLLNPYDNWAHTKMDSLGIFNGNRIPNILLTMQYKLDSKGNILDKPKPLFLFQPDGPCSANLNFRSDSLKIKPAAYVCRFWVQMDITFGEGVTNSQKLTVGGELGMEKKFKSALNVGTEFGTESPGERYYVHAQLEGMLVARERKLELWGQIL